jgi:protein involved in polysaccharide export with SLBB domain
MRSVRARPLAVFLLGVCTPIAAQQSLPPGVTPEMVEAYRNQQSNGTTPTMPVVPPTPVAPYSLGGANAAQVQVNPIPPPPAPNAAEYAPPMANAQVTESTLDTAPVFGRNLWQGNFATQSFKGFNPDYVVGVGDLIDLRLWGAVNLQTQIAVDAQGNIFVPHVGPVKVADVANGELNQTVSRLVRQVYRADVGVYATLAASIPVKVYVTGFVKRPGLYPGYAADSLLNFLDRAGGVDALAGSYVDVRVLRGDKTVASVNLYDFLVKGSLRQLQMHDGDSIFVGPIGHTAMVQGLVASPAQFEFKPGTTIRELLAMAGVHGRATNVSVSRSVGTSREVKYVTVNDPALDGPAVTGDVIMVMADRLLGQIAITLEGEHEGVSQYVLPYNATLSDLLAQVRYSPQSRRDVLQLYRRSVAERQKQVLDDMLRKLEQAVLTARAATDSEADLRRGDAQLALQFIDRARLIHPKGQIVLPSDIDPKRIALEDGDIVRIPRESQLVQVHGEVYLPNAFVWSNGSGVNDYIRQAGGLTQASNGDRVLLMRPSGEVTVVNGGFIRPAVAPGDEILVLPAVDTKHFQFGKDVVQIIYQIAIAAGVVARL